MISLKVDNLTYRTTPEDLRRVFERCGSVGDIYIPRDRHTRESRGFAFVRFYEKRDAEEALQEMDGRVLDGRELRVQMARYGRPTSPQRRRYDRRRSNRSRSRGGSRDRDRRRRSPSYEKRRRDRSERSRSRDNKRRSESNSKSRSASKSSREHSPVRRNRSQSRE
ncbi:hypothetical protein ACKWTF_000834 [Chironomus riparius]